MLGYFEKKPVVPWILPSENRPRMGVLDGVLSLAAHVQMQRRASTAAIYQSGTNGANGVKLDPVLRAHWGLDAFK